MDARQTLQQLRPRIFMDLDQESPQ